MSIEIISQTIQGASRTHIGYVRTINEDSFAYCSDFASAQWVSNELEFSTHHLAFIVADGMGGTNAGEVASKIAVNTFSHSVTNAANLISLDENSIIQLLKKTVLQAHDDIIDYAAKNPESKGMGTTVIAGLIMNEKVFIIWVGDSRAYRYYNNANNQSVLEMISRDHSLVWELVEQGKLSSEEARLHPHSNIITQSLGEITHTPRPEFRVFDIYNGDRLLFCSDGLHGMLSDQSINRLLDHYKNTQEAADQLTAQALVQGGEDNITFLLLDIVSNKIRMSRKTENGQDRISTKSGDVESYQKKEPRFSRSSDLNNDVASPLKIETPLKVALDPPKKNKSFFYLAIAVALLSGIYVLLNHLYQKDETKRMDHLRNIIYSQSSGSESEAIWAQYESLEKKYKMKLLSLDSLQMMTDSLLKKQKLMLENLNKNSNHIQDTGQPLQLQTEDVKLLPKRPIKPTQQNKNEKPKEQKSNIPSIIDTSLHEAAPSHSEHDNQNPN
jgi:serine/threonine protein phosphatase PrpC